MEQTKKHYQLPEGDSRQEDDFYNPLFDVEMSNTRETPQYGQTKMISLPTQVINIPTESTLNPDCESGDSFGGKNL